MKDYIHYMRNNKDEDPLYLFDGDFADAAPPLAHDYKILDYFKEDFFESCLELKDRPNFRWLVIGPSRSGSAWHMDPYLTSAWNALISGQKRWMFYQYNCPCNELKEKIEQAKEQESQNHETTGNHGYTPAPSYLECSEPLDWLCNEYVDACRDQQRPWECIQNPGEVIFVPSGWWHAVLNVTDTVAVTQNFVNSQNLPQVMLEMEKHDPKTAKIMKEKLIKDYNKVF
jgi:hypothetical protein